MGGHGGIALGHRRCGELLESVERYRAKGRDRAIVDLMGSRADDVCVSLRSP